MTTLRDELFELLPLVYRQRDAEPPQDDVLQALLQILGEQGDVVAADIAQLYDDWFIETSADWLVPYLGDLLGVRLLHPVGPGASRQRALVADTLDLRSRKGTLAVLEQLAYDVTGWPVAAVEYFTRLEATQYLAHLRPGVLQSPDLRRVADLELVSGPFSTASHNAEARRIPRGRFGIQNIGLHVWRLAPQRVAHATARAAHDPPDGRYFVDPAGGPVPLFNRGTTETSITSLAREQNVPGPLRRRPLFDELETMRANSDYVPVWFGTDPVFEVFADLGSGLEAIPPDELTVADLSDPPAPIGVGWPRPAPPMTAAVDPVLGRVAFRADLAPTSVEVTSSFATPGSVGAGTYDRTQAETEDLLNRATWFRAVGARATPVPGAVVNSLAAAVTDWTAEPAGTVGVIAVIDSRTYAEDLSVSVPAGSELLVVAVTWPDAEDAGNVTVVLSLDQASATDRRPHLLGSVTATGTTGVPDGAPGNLTVDGLLIEGDVTVDAGDLGLLALRHSTVAPFSGGVRVAPATGPASDNGSLDVVIDRSIVGRITVADRGPQVAVTTSVVDGTGGAAISAPDVPLSLDRVTVLGPASAQQLDASDCVLAGLTSVARQQTGCLRFSSLTQGAVVPRRYRCQPDLALTDVTDPGEAAAVRTRLLPVFSSTTYGDPDYARLDDRCDELLRTGASNGASMGVFAELEEPHRMANLAAVLEEYLRLGLDAGVIHET